MSALGLEPLRLVLASTDLRGGLLAALPEIQGADLDAAALDLTQAQLGLCQRVEFEWTLSRPARTRRARLAVLGTGEQLHLEGFLEDVTVLRQNEQAARVRVRALESWLEALPDAILVIEGGAIVGENRAAQLLLGAGSLLGRPLLGLVPSDHHAALAAHARPASACPPTTLQLLGDSGRYVEVVSAALPGATASRLLVLRDVTPRREAELRAAAAERMASVGRLAAGIAHEINNPLTFVGLNLAMLREDLEAWLQSDENGAGQKLDDAVTGVKRVADIVRQLRLFANTRECGRQGCSVGEAILLARQLSRFALPAKVTVSTTLPEGLPLVAMPVGALSQVVLNLTINASDAIADSGGASGHVHISARSARGGVDIDIQDDGPGIPEALWGRIFEPFYTTKAPGSGTGLGLAIVRTLVHEAGGTIGVVASPSGACFRISLPRWVEGVEAAAAPAPVGPATGPRALTVLVVDDEPALLRALSSHLSKGFVVVTAADGQEACALIEGGLRPDAILCDIEMPRMDGGALHEWLLRQHPSLADRLIVMTGGTLEPSRTAALRRAGRDVLHKPLDLHQLRQAVVAAAEQGGGVEEEAVLSTAERRAAPRRSKEGLSAVLALGTDAHRAKVVDLSSTGLRLRNGVLAPGDLLGRTAQVLLRHPEGGPDEVLSLPVAAVWARQINARSMEYGFERVAGPQGPLYAAWMERVLAGAD